MIDQKQREDTYKKIKNRIEDKRYLSAFLTMGTVALAVLLVLSLFPLVPIIIAALTGLAPTSLTIVYLWFFCIFLFGGLFWIFQRFDQKIEVKRGITLEERMYVKAYESMCLIRERLDPDHPVLGSGSKAVRRLIEIVYLLESVGFPNAVLVREQANQFWHLRNNLKTRLIPSISKALNMNDSKLMETIFSAITDFLDYLLRPQLVDLASLNQKMLVFPESKDRSISEDIKALLLRRSNLRHVMAFSTCAVISLLIFYVDSYLGASQSEAFTLGIGSIIALVTLYVTYLGLTKRKESKG